MIGARLAGYWPGLGGCAAVAVDRGSITEAIRETRQLLEEYLHRSCRRVRLIWADAGYAAGELVGWAIVMKMTIEIVAKRDRHVFEVLPRRWVVERTFAWISKYSRTVRDYGQLPASHEAMIL